MVVVGHPADDRDVNRVDVENRAGSASAVRHLCELGRRQVGYIGPTADYRFAAERLDGYRDALIAAGRPFDERLVRLTEPTAEHAYEAARSLMAEDPDAVHVGTDPMAGGVLLALNELGCGVPDDVAVVGFDGLPSAPPTNPILTTVVQPVVDVGRTAVELLLGDDSEPTVVVLPTYLRVGRSCGATP